MDQRVHNLAELLPELLSSVGLELTSLHWVTEPDRGFEAKAVLSRRGNVQHYALVFAAAMTLTQITHLRPPEIDAPLLVVGKRITERSATAFRDQKIQYIDTLATPTSSSEMSTSMCEQKAEHTYPPGRPVQTSHPPSARRVGVALDAQPFQSPPSFAGCVRTIDLASADRDEDPRHRKRLRRLDRSGTRHPQLARRSGFPPSGSATTPLCLHEILQPWALEYPRGLRKRLTLARFYTDEPTHFQPLRPDQEFFFSGESAEGVDIQHPTTLTVYVEHFDRKLAFVNRWRDDPDQVPNVRVLQKFWTPPDEHPGSEDSKRDGPPNAPWPLVYADLLALNDPRLREVAETWRTLCSI